MSRKIEPCSICERYMDGVICEEKECPVAIMKEEIERLKQKVNGFQELWCEAESDLRTVKVEAIKEFAEVLKKRLSRKYTIYGREYVLRHIREVVKEMTEGEQHEQK